MICPEGVRKLDACETKADYFRVLCDSFAIDFIPQLLRDGVRLPIEDFCKEFGNYLNGKRVMEYPMGYTSKMYMSYRGDIVADTTIVSCIECGGDIIVPKNCFARVVLSHGCDFAIRMDRDSKLIIEAWGDAKYSISGDLARVREYRY